MSGQSLVGKSPSENFLDSTADTGFPVKIQIGSHWEDTKFPM